MKTFEYYCEEFLKFNIITFDNKDFKNDSGISEEIWEASYSLRNEFQLWVRDIIGSHEKYSVVANFEWKVMLIGLRVD